jgi:transposase InsO family protein
MLAEGVSCGLHRIERLMRLQALRAHPRRCRLPPDLGERQAAAVAPNVLDRTFEFPTSRMSGSRRAGSMWGRAGEPGQPVIILEACSESSCRAPCG